MTAADHRATIGLEVHAQLMTRSKMFCGCRADYLGLPPNSNTCPTCLGLPGTLPVINQRAVELTVLTGLALGCRIPEFTKFDRKNYFYPDLPKGYQISQYDLPLAEAGSLEFEVGTEVRRVGITRVHLEEDAGLLHHAGEIQASAFSLVDLNRAGVPLIEIVGEPDLRSPAEAGVYLRALRQTLVYLGVSDGNMEEGSLRCDANVSVQLVGDGPAAGKVEIKNMNSFRIVQQALEFELNRQAELLQGGAEVPQETRGWSEEERATVSQRLKEEAHDYRYFPEPDLPPLTLTQAWVGALRQQLPELPLAKRERLRSHYRLEPEPARQLTERAADADYFEAVVAAGADPRSAANWQTGDLQGLCRAAHLEPSRCPVGPADLAELVQMVDRGEVSRPAAKEVLAEAFNGASPPAQLVRERGLGQVSDQDELGAMVDSVLAAMPKAVEDFQGGKEQALEALVGGVMGRSKGKANPAVVKRLLRERLPH